MRSVFITLFIIMGTLVVAFNLFQKFRLERPVGKIRITTEQALDPRVVTVKEGEDVMWVNDSDSVMVVTSIPEKSQHAYLLNQSTSSASFHIGRIKPGKSRKMTFYEKGRYLYVCEALPGRGVTTGIVQVEERE
ncbi:MAG: plastocyanin/azurin family copper-binding protein [Cyclobacteriaceae bacterium]